MLLRTTFSRDAQARRSGARLLDAIRFRASGMPASISHMTQGEAMIRRIYFALSTVTLLVALSAADRAQAQQAYGRAWGNTYSNTDWQRFYHYPYVYYPQNYWGNEYYRS